MYKQTWICFGHRFLYKTRKRQIKLCRMKNLVMIKYLPIANVTLPCGRAWWHILFFYWECHPAMRQGLMAHSFFSIANATLPWGRVHIKLNIYPMFRIIYFNKKNPSYLHKKGFAKWNEKMRLGAELATNNIQCTTVFKPTNLLFVIRMIDTDIFAAAICMV